MSADLEAFVAAAEKGDAPKVAEMLAATPSLATASRTIRGEEERNVALFRAAALGHAAVVRQLIKAGADPNVFWREDYGTPLVGAAEMMSPGSAETVRVLLDHGADPALGEPLLMALTTYARTSDRPRVIRLLSEMGETAGQHAGVLAVLAGDAKDLTHQLARDPSVASRRYPEVDYLAWPLDHGSPTLMHIAADAGEVAMVSLLLAAGADINVRAGAGTDGLGFQTPIYHAVASQNAYSLPVLRLLIERRADLGVTAKVRFPQDTVGACVASAGKTMDLKPLGLAMQFEHGPAWRNSGEAARLLRDAGAIE